MKQKTLQIDKTKEESNFFKLMEWAETEFLKLPDGKYEIVIRKPVRTPKQNRALHVFCEIIADALNESHRFFKNGLCEVFWSGDMVLEFFWRPLQIDMFKKKSTTKITTDEFTMIAEAIQRGFSTELGIILNFPSRDAVERGELNYEIIK